MLHYGVGLGMLGEKGGESIRADFNTLTREFKHTVEDLNGLRMIVKKHCISTLQQGLAKIPKVQQPKRCK